MWGGPFCCVKKYDLLNGEDIIQLYTVEFKVGVLEGIG